MPLSLTVSEIFKSLQGEGARAGRPCAIVRLAGCNLRCRWCDTAYAQAGGAELGIEHILEQVAAMRCRLVMLTGGEPLLQADAGELLRALCEASCEVLLQTNGSLDISGVDERVVRCVDCKCPGSGQAGSFLFSNLRALRPTDELKFVLADRGDYDYAQLVIRQYELLGRVKLILSPAWGVPGPGPPTAMHRGWGPLSPADLARWMLDEPHWTGDVRLGLQLHKLIWPEADRGV